MIIMSPEGNIPHDLTKVQRLFHALHRVYHLSLDERPNLETASNKAISSGL